MIDLEKYKGLPYRDHGRDMTGVDCWGLVWLVYSDMGIDLPSWSTEYSRADSVELLSVEHCFGGWQVIDGRPKPLDVALFAVRGNFHVGLVIDKRGSKMMHITRGNKVTEERIDSVVWKSCFRGFYHYDR